MKRSKGLSRGKQLKRETPVPGDTGPSDEVRQVVLERDGYQCAGCGRSIIGIWYSLQHRDARGMGGTSDPAANWPENLVTMCGSATSPGCHRKAEDRDTTMHDRGFWLEEGDDPLVKPVAYWMRRGLRSYRLTVGGDRIPCASDEAAA